MSETLPPTPKQLNALRKLALRRGMTFAWPKTGAQASRHRAPGREGPFAADERRADRDAVTLAGARTCPPRACARTRSPATGAEPAGSRGAPPGGQVGSRPGSTSPATAPARSAGARRKGAVDTPAAALRVLGRHKETATAGGGRAAPKELRRRPVQTATALLLGPCGARPASARRGPPSHLRGPRKPSETERGIGSEPHARRHFSGTRLYRRRRICNKGRQPNSAQQETPEPCSASPSSSRPGRRLRGAGGPGPGRLLRRPRRGAGALGGDRGGRGRPLRGARPGRARGPFAHGGPGREAPLRRTAAERASRSSAWIRAAASPSPSGSPCARSGATTWCSLPPSR